MLLDVDLHQRVESSELLRRQSALLVQDRAQGPGLVQNPGMHGRYQLLPANEVHLQRENAEEKIAIGDC